MATQSARGQRSTDEAVISGWVFFAAIMLTFGGIMGIFQGISAIAKDDVFVATRNFTFEWSLTGWGWLHLILGILVTLTGLALFKAAPWARVVGIVVAGLSMLANFTWLPWYPFWAFTMIVVDAIIIAALCAAPSRDT